MQHDDLVRQINQIARYFDAYPEVEAIAGVANHVRKFWAPDMRAQIIDGRQQLAERLHPLARAALEQLAVGLASQ
jgi:formate dehydrogenase subunit delta